MTFDQRHTSSVPVDQLTDAVGIALLGFFNVLWGSPEVGQTELLEDRPDGKSADAPDGLRLLKVFIDRFDVISRRAGWTGFSLLASALAIVSWIEHSSDRTDELMMLLGVHKILEATEVIVGNHDLDVVVLQSSVEEALENTKWI